MGIKVAPSDCRAKTTKWTASQAAKEARRPLLTIEQVPRWLRFNKFIRDGYRRQATNPLLSILQWHNETCNIWTHLAAALLFLKVALSANVHWMVSVASLALAVNFFGSVYYHSWMSRMRTQADYDWCLGTDVLACMVGITVSALSFLWWGYKCQSPLERAVYLGVFLLAAFLTVRILSGFQTTSATTRFLSLGLFCVLRFLLYFLTGGREYLFTNGHWEPFYYHVSSFFILLIGGVINITRFPERWVDSRLLDYIGNSHNIWHVMSALSGWTTIVGVMHDHAEFLTTTC
jgi:adiponectin receptor